MAVSLDVFKVLEDALVSGVAEDALVSGVTEDDLVSGVAEDDLVSGVAEDDLVSGVTGGFILSVSVGILSLYVFLSLTPNKLLTSPAIKEPKPFPPKRSLTTDAIFSSEARCIESFKLFPS